MDRERERSEPTRSGYHKGDPTRVEAEEAPPRSMRDGNAEVMCGIVRTPCGGGYRVGRKRAPY